jgi:hypothetical protein
MCSTLTGPHCHLALRVLPAAEPAPLPSAVHGLQHDLHGGGLCVLLWRARGVAKQARAPADWIRLVRVGHCSATLGEQRSGGAGVMRRVAAAAAAAAAELPRLDSVCSWCTVSGEPLSVSVGCNFSGAVGVCRSSSSSSSSNKAWPAFIWRRAATMVSDW